MLVFGGSPWNNRGDRHDHIPDFNAGGYRFADLLREGIVSSRGNLNYLQTRLGFPRPVKIGLSAAWYPKSEVHAWLAKRAALRDRPANAGS